MTTGNENIENILTTKELVKCMKVFLVFFHN